MHTGSYGGSFTHFHGNLCALLVQQVKELSTWLLRIA